MIQQYLREGDYTSARRVLELWQNQFQHIASQTVAAWQSRFQAAASRQVDEADRLLSQKQYIPAQSARSGFGNLARSGIRHASHGAH